MSENGHGAVEADIHACERLLDAGDPDAALVCLQKRAGRRGDLGKLPPPLPALACEALLACERPAEAECVAETALATVPEDPDLLTWRACARFRLWRFADALADAERALAIEPELAAAHHVGGLSADHLGRPDAAELHLVRAARADPEAFPVGVRMTRDAFDRVVQETLAEVRADGRFTRILEEVAVVVEDLPGDAVRQAGADAPDLLGFFAGRALDDRAADTSWGPGDGAPHPGTLFLFRKNLARACETRDELRTEIRVTVLHELAHLLGFDEEEMHELGLE